MSDAAAAGPDDPELPAEAARSPQPAAPESDTDEDPLGRPGPPFSRRAPYMIGLLGGLGLLTAWFLATIVRDISSVLVQVLVALFLAAGVNPLVAFLERRGMRRAYATLTVIVLVLVGLALFLVALVPVISDQVRAISSNVPGWLDDLQHNNTIRQFNGNFHVLDKIQSYVTKGDFVTSLFGGVLGVGLAVLGFLANAFIVIVLTLYFIASYDKTKRAIYSFAPASRRERVSKLGERIFEGIGGYVSGAFVVASCAGISSLVFLFIVGLGRYAVALAFVVMLTDVIPLIGATIGAVIVTAIAFATDVRTGIISAIFYIAYQQFENYAIYPRVMSRAVNIPGLVTVIAALVGASLLGIIGALMAIPTAAAVLIIVREVLVRAQDER